MNTNKILMTVTRTISVIVIAIYLSACDNEFGSMHMNNRSMHMDNLNWTLILICVGIGFILGWFVHKRRRR